MLRDNLISSRRFATLLGAAALALFSIEAGCAGHEFATSGTGGGATSSTTTGTGGRTASSSTGTGTGGQTTSSSTGSATGGAGGAGGGAVNNGPPAVQLVGAGDRCESATYTLVHTTGQPTQNQSQSTSPSYVIQGGLIGANGSLK